MFPYQLEGNIEKQEDLFGPYIKCINPRCKQTIPLKSTNPYCTDRCRHAHKLDRFLDEGTVN